jgi:GTP cyclohydrolase I
MNTTVDLYPGVNGNVGVNNGQNGVVHICDHRETASHDRCKLSKLAHVDSEELLRELLRRIGEDPDREGLRQSPARIIRSWNELFSGYDQRADDVLVTQFHAEQYDEMVLLRDVEFCSTCEHHMLPFCGEAHIGYIRDQKIVSLSKLARLLDVFAHADSRYRNA